MVFSLRCNLPDEEEVRRLAERISRKLDIDDAKKYTKDFVPLLVLDGMRTGSEFEGKLAYLDGADFGKKFVFIHKVLGGKNMYLHLTGEFHRTERENYPLIYEAFIDEAEEWKEFTSKCGIGVKFFGNFDVKLGPNSLPDLRPYLKALEDSTSKFDFKVYIQMNYSIEWAVRMGLEYFKDFPDVNVVIRPTKGQATPGQIFIPGKIQDYTFVYVQQGSCDSTWSLRQLVFLYLICLRAMMKNFYVFKSDRGKYEEERRKKVKKLREKEALFIDENFYDEELDEGKDPKVVVMFSEVGPERYTF
jgi:hypothetical protein